MYEAVTSIAKQQDYIIMSAAVGDYACQQIADEKIKKSVPQLTLQLT